MHSNKRSEGIASDGIFRTVAPREKYLQESTRHRVESWVWRSRLSGETTDGIARLRYDRKRYLPMSISLDTDFQ